MTDQRTFDGLRGQPREPPAAELEMDAAAFRFSETTDGKTILAWMEKELDVIYSPDAPDGALRELNGARRFRAKLLAHIERGRKDRRRPEPES